MSIYHEPSDNAERAVVTILAELAAVANQTPARLTAEDIKTARRVHWSGRRPRPVLYRQPAWVWLAVIVSARGRASTRVQRTTLHEGTTNRARNENDNARFRSRVTSISLPIGSWFNQISVSDGLLLLSGEVASSRNSSAVCVAATLDPQTLQLKDTTKGSCKDPAIFGESVAVVNTNLPENDASISIARIDPRTGRMSLGPVIMTYASLSDTRPVVVYGGGWLWIYDVDTTRDAELLQVSTSSGRVEDDVTMPQLYRPVLAANDDGLWIGNSVQGSQAPDVLYHVLPGSDAVTAVVSGSSLKTLWLVGSGDSLWAGIGPSMARQTIWRFDGSEPRPVFRVNDRDYDPTAVVGDEAEGLWTVVPYPPVGSTLRSGPYPEDVIRIDPDSGKETVVAVLPRTVLAPDDEGLTTGQASYINGSLFVLEPPFEAYGYLGYSKLVRVRTQG